MTIKLYIPRPFDRFEREGNLIGRMVVEYGDIEWLLCLLVSHIIESLDIAVKTLYRVKSEASRIDIADALIRNRIDPKIKQIYETTLARVHECRKLRNRYAHANWLHAGSNKLCYIDIEELARDHAEVDMVRMTLYHLDLATVEDQARFFMEVQQNLTYLNMEAQYLNGSSSATGFHYIPNILGPKQAVMLESLA